MKILDPTLNAGKVEWLPRSIQLGEIPYDIPVQREFEVKNVGTDTLFLKKVNPGCHCTLVEYTKDPILPGQSGKVVAIYDAKKEGSFYKIISVATNFDEKNLVTLSLTGKVVK